MSESAITNAKLPIPVLEQFLSVLQTTTTASGTRTKVPATALAYRRAILIQNNHTSNTVYLGSVTVTADTGAAGGYQLGPSDSVVFTLDGSVDLYAIASASSTPVTTLEFA